jgi:hypothetical protein
MIVGPSANHACAQANSSTVAPVPTISAMVALSTKPSALITSSQVVRWKPERLALTFLQRRLVDPDQIVSFAFGAAKHKSKLEMPLR